MRNPTGAGWTGRASISTGQPLLCRSAHTCRHASASTGLSCISSLPACLYFLGQPLFPAGMLLLLQVSPCFVMQLTPVSILVFLQVTPCFVM